MLKINSLQKTAKNFDKYTFICIYLVVVIDLLINENDFISRILSKLHRLRFFIYSDFLISDFGPIPLLLNASIWK